jgi:hypothetical protein
MKKGFGLGNANIGLLNQAMGKQTKSYKISSEIKFNQVAGLHNVKIEV